MIGDKRGRFRFMSDFFSLFALFKFFSLTYLFNSSFWLLYLRLWETKITVFILLVGFCIWSAKSSYFSRISRSLLHGDNFLEPVSYTHLRAHETDSYLVCRL